MLNPSRLARALCLTLVLGIAAPLAGHAQTNEAVNNSILGDWGVAYIDSWEGPAPPRGAYITFKTDGRMGGFNGCNVFHGKYSFDGATLKFPHGLGVTTRKFCGPPAGTLARKFSDAIAREMKAVRTPDQLELLDANGKVRLRLTKTS